METAATYQAKETINEKDGISIGSGDGKSADTDDGAAVAKTTKDDKKTNTKPLPSYTSMIAQAILNKATQRSTLSEIYEFMERKFVPLREKGNGWRNCVRHTLSLSDCFMKLHRPENGRSCHWAIHPSYLARFIRGDYRKRRQSRTRRANQDASAHDQYAFHQMMYEREAAAVAATGGGGGGVGYDGRIMQVSPMAAAGPVGDLMERQRHYNVPSCSAAVVSLYGHVSAQQASHNIYQNHQTPETSTFYHHQGQYNREYRNSSDAYHQYLPNHNPHY
eukprot:gene20017-21978_t